MSEKISETQIYLFLANQRDWKCEADINSNGEITKGEMREYLSSSDFENWCGVSIRDMSADAFNKFWANIDSNVHNNKLDEKELNRTMVQMDAIKEVKSFIDKKASDIPAGLDKYSDLWKTELTNALNETILKYIKGISFDITELTDAMKQEINSLLETSYASAKTTAAVQCYIQKYTDENAGNSEIKALKGYGYLITDDKDLERIIKNWITQNEETDVNKIGEAIKSLIEGYLASAQIGDGDVSVLKSNNGYNASKLNELQMAKLTKEAKSVLGDSLMGRDLGFTIEGANGPINLNGGGYDGIYRKYVEQFVKSYLEGGYKNATRIDGQSLFDAALNELKTNAMGLFKASKAGENFITEIQFADNYRFAWESKDFFKEIVAAGIDGIDKDGALVQGSDLANLKNWLNSDIGEGKFPEYYAAYNKILESVLNPYDNTYRKSDGSINYDKINTELLDIVKAKFGLITKTSSTNGTNDSSSTPSVETNINWSSLPNNDKTGYNGNFIDGSTGMIYFSNLYSYNTKIDLITVGNKQNNSGWHKNTDWTSAVGNAKTNLASFVTSLSAACASTGKYDQAALETAKNKVITIYNMAFDQSIDGTHWANGGSGNGTSSWNINYGDEVYSYAVDKSKKESTSDNDIYSRTSSLGLRIQESTNSPRTFKIHVEPKVVMDLFAKFYAAALK